MLAGVGCKDYDDDIDKVNDRLDQLETGKLASVEQQIAAINSSISSLEAAYKAADAELKSALEKQASDLAAAKSALEASIKSLKDTHDADIQKLTGDLNTLSSKVESYNKTLSEEIEAVAKDLTDNYYDKKTIDEKLAALDSKFAGQISALDAKITACNEAIDAIEAQIETMKEQIAGKVNQLDYEAFTKATNEAIQKNTMAISVLTGLCEGIPEGQTIKGYIDAAKADVVGMLGELEETYEAFVEAYNELKLDERLATAEGEIDELQEWKEELMKAETGTLALLEQRLQEQIDAKTTLDEVKGTYNADCDEFLSGVNGIISSALAEGGLIDNKLKSKLSALETKLQEQIDALELRIDALEGQVEALVAQIQSLVYVPAFADGTTEMETYAFGGNEAGNAVVLKFRVSPAAMAAKMAALNEAGALSLVTEEVATRTAAPAATITGVEVVDADAGTFAVSAQIANYPAAANKAVAVALAVNAVIEGTNVSNDVVSNFAGVVKPATPINLEFALFDAEGNKYANDDIKINWNTTKEDSKREILKDLELKVSLDGGTTYMSLADASAKIGATIAADKYATTSTPTASDANYTITNVTDKAWGSVYASVQFKADGTNALVGNNVEFSYSIKAKLADNAAAEAVTGTVIYKPVNETGATLAFAKLSKDWTYDFVATGIGVDAGSDTAMPAINENNFGEIALTVEAGSIPAGVKLSDIMGVTPVKSIKVDGQDVSADADFDFEAFANDIVQGVKVNVPMNKYAWGKTYDIEYTYSYQNVDYVLKGTIAFGAVPAEVKYDYPAVEIGYEDKAITGAWKTVYDAWKAAGNAGFASDAEFADAIFAGTNAPTVTPETKLFNEANPTGTLVADTEGTEMVANVSTLTGDLKKADITANGDKFVQTATWTTWYGQKVTVTMTYNVKLPTYVLTVNDTWVNADGIVGTKGGVDATTEKWSVKLNGAVKDYFYYSPLNDLIEKQYVKKSVNGTPAGSVYAEVAGDATEPTVTWKNGVTTEKDIVMTAKLVLDGKVTVASEDFTIHADDPIKTFTQTAEQEVQYVPNGKLEVNLLKGISLVDINGTAWINADGTIVETQNNNYGPDQVFSMLTGNATTAGIEFDTAKMTNTGNLTLSINGNKLEYTNDGSVMQKDVTVTIPAKITYWLGEKETTITVVIRK
ncbi:MAG: hypothetical protein LUH46_06660 [Alistipes sp.]|nr:hypothetical protein [Alistipes sp.]